MMDPVLYLGESPPPWPIRDSPNHIAAGAGDITCERSKDTGLDVFWDTTKTNQAGSESLLSQVVVSEAEFAPLEDTPTTPPTGPQPPSIQHKIKSFLLDIFIDVGRRGQRMLTALHQLFGIAALLNEGLRRFRNYYCAEHQYGVSVEDTTRLGPPGRVLTLGSPELCPDVQYYSNEEFPLMEDARGCGIRGYAAIPLFQRDGQCCVGLGGVLELSSLDVRLFRPRKVLPLEKYDLEMQVHRCKWDKIIRFSAQIVKLKHPLGLVQVWVACLCHIAPDATSSGQYDAHNICNSSNPASPSRITVRNDTSSVARAYSPKKPCFVRHFSQFYIFDCALLPLIRWLQLAACFAIALQLIHPKFDLYWCDRNAEAMLKLFLFTLKEKCSTDQVQVEKFSVKLSHWDFANLADLDVDKHASIEFIYATDQERLTEETSKAGYSRGVEVSPNAAGAEITLDDIKQCFGLKLNDAAEKLGVSRSTLKRRCRELGIKKWPSPKRKNIHRIQSLEKYDPAYNQVHRYKWDKTPPPFTRKTRRTVRSLAECVQQKHRLSLVQTPPPFTPETRPTIRSLADFVQEKHGLGLVQVWVPGATSSGQYDAHNSCSSSNPASPTKFLRDYFTPSGFRTTDDVPQPGLERDDGSLVGKAYSQKKPCFVPNFNLFNIFDCLLLPAPCGDLEACFAIPLQSIHPKFDSFVLELFFPLGMNLCDRNAGAILESLLFTIKERCSTDQVQAEKFSVQLSHTDSHNVTYFHVYQNGSSDAAGAGITLDDITQYFGLKLNDAAEKLGVSRSTLKRRCRELGIEKWPLAKRKNVLRIQSSPRTPTRFVEGGAEVIPESEIEPPCPNNNQTERDAAASDTIPKSAKGKNIAAQDKMDLDHSYTMIVKATYNDKIVMFRLGSNSRIEELRRELDKRFEFKAEGFEIKYQDEDEGDWILVSCDEDLRFRMDNLKSSGQTRMHVSIFPATL